MTTLYVSTQLYMCVFMYIHIHSTYTHTYAFIHSLTPSFSGFLVRRTERKLEKSAFDRVVQALTWMYQEPIFDLVEKLVNTDCVFWFLLLLKEFYCSQLLLSFGSLSGKIRIFCFSLSLHFSFTHFLFLLSSYFLPSSVSLSLVTLYLSLAFICSSD